jgi:hypothetical protein
MKILWFTNTPSLYEQGKHQYYGGGWIESLEEIVKDQKEIELAVSFFYNKEKANVMKNGTTYYPIYKKSGKSKPFKTVLNNWLGILQEENFDDLYLNIINDFQPDVIHVFGTEGPFFKIQGLTKIPVIIHIQGIINPYLNTYYPVNQSKWSFLLSMDFFYNNLIGSSPVFEKKKFTAQAKREQKFLTTAKYVMGRTHWDKILTELYNPNVKYFT